MKQLYEMTGWLSFHGCPICTVRGRRLNGRMCFPFDANNPPETRSLSAAQRPGNILFDATQAERTGRYVNGFKGMALSGCSNLETKLKLSYEINIT